MANDWDGWSTSAGAWIRSMTEQGDWTRRHVLDRPTQAACSPSSGEQWLDLGCGEGRFCRWLAEQGAIVVGLDPVAELLQHATSRGGSKYVLGEGSYLPFRNATFDGVVSYLSLIDIPDFRTAILEAARVLRPGGKFVVANLTSFATTIPHPRRRDEQGNFLFMAVDRYLEERAEWVEWADIRVRNWHRPLAAYMQAFLAAGFTLESFDEPAADPEVPGGGDYNRAPWGLVMVWRKPA